MSTSVRSDGDLITSCAGLWYGSPSCGSRRSTRLQHRARFSAPRPRHAAVADRRGCRRGPRRQLRIVDEHGSGAHDDRVAGPAAPMHVGAGGLAGDPLTAAVGRRTAAIDAGGEFPCDMRKPGAGSACATIRASATGNLVGQHPCDHPHTRLRGRVARPQRPHSDRSPRAQPSKYPRRTRASTRRRRPAVMVARLEGDHSRPRRRVPARRSATTSGMGAAGRLRCTDANGLAIATRMTAPTAQIRDRYRPLPIRPARRRAASATSKLIAGGALTRRRPACAAPRRRPAGSSARDRDEDVHSGLCGVLDRLGVDAPSISTRIVGLGLVQPPAGDLGSTSGMNFWPPKPLHDQSAACRTRAGSRGTAPAGCRV